MGPNASAATTRTDGSRTPPQFNAPLKSARRRACGNGDNANASPTVPQENKTGRSGHLMCYQNRTSSFAIDRAQLGFRQFLLLSRTLLSGDEKREIVASKGCLGQARSNRGV